MQALVASSEGKMTLHLLLHTRLNRKDLTRDKNSSLTMQIETLNWWGDLAKDYGSIITIGARRR